MSSKTTKPFAHAQVTGGTGATTRKRGVYSVFRNAQGDWRIIWPRGRELRASEFNFKLTAVNPAARIIQLGDTGSTAAPGGANAPAGSLALQVLAFDAGGAAIDTDFVFEAHRI